MPDQLQLRGGTTAQHASFTGVSKEVTIDTTKKTAVVHDGTTAGGNPLLREDASNSALALGSAGTPSLKFTGDTNTGIYSPGADQVAISTNGTGRLFVDASGNVGVGTAPSQLFHIAGASATALLAASSGVGTLRLTRGATTADLSVSTALATLATTSATDFAFSTNNTERLRITSTGTVNIVGAGTAGSTQAVSFNGSAPINSLVIDSSGRLGVGTSSPSARLHVTDLTAGAVEFLRLQANLTSPSGNKSITWADLTDVVGRISLDYTSPTAKMRFGSLYNSGYQTSDLMTLTPTGLGIGTSSVSKLLHLAANDGNAAILLARSNSGTASLGQVGFSTVNGTVAGIDATAVTDSNNGTLRFWTTGGSPQSDVTTLNSSTPRMVITSAGLVGIGTTSVSNKFVVSNGGAEGYEISPGFASNDNLLLSINRSGGVYCGNTQNASFHRWLIQDNEKARIDSSGRLLVGTSSASAAATSVLVQGNGSSSTAEGIIRLTRGTTTPGASDELGTIAFGDSNHNTAAYLACNRDGGTWNTSTSRPTRLVFSTTADGASSPTERMRITNKGYVATYCDNVAGGYGLYVASAVAASSSSYLILGTNGATGTLTGTTSFIVATNGNVTNTNNSYGAISDIKLKENIVDAGSQWDDLKSLQVRKYNFKKGQTHTQIGLVAQEVELVSPGLVTESPDRDAEGNDLGTVTKSVNYSVLYMKAVKALQEAMERIEQLEAKVAALESA